MQKHIILKLEHGKTVSLITGEKFYSSHKLLFNYRIGFYTPVNIQYWSLKQYIIYDL